MGVLGQVRGNLCHRSSKRQTSGSFATVVFLSSFFKSHQQFSDDSYTWPRFDSPSPSVTSRWPTPLLSGRRSQLRNVAPVSSLELHRVRPDRPETFSMCLYILILYNLCFPDSGLANGVRPPTPRGGTFHSAVTTTCRRRLLPASRSRVDLRVKRA